MLTLLHELILARPRRGYSAGTEFRWCSTAPSSDQSCLSLCLQPCWPLGPGQIQFQGLESPLGFTYLIVMNWARSPDAALCRDSLFSQLLTFGRTAGLQAAGGAGGWGSQGRIVLSLYLGAEYS